MYRQQSSNPVPWHRAQLAPAVSRVKPENTTGDSWEASSLQPERRDSVARPRLKTARGFTAGNDSGTVGEDSTEPASKLQYFALPCVNHTEARLRTPSFAAGSCPRPPRECRIIILPLASPPQDNG